jgi:acyl dehydratase
MLSGDWHPIHADATFAAASPVGQRTFHGGYGIFLCLGVAASFPDVGTRSAVALGTESWKFTAPLFVGDTVHVEVEIIEMRRTSDGKRAIVQRRVRLVKGGGEVAQEGVAGLLVYLSAEQGDYDTAAAQS